MAKITRLRELPEISAEYNRYAELNPEFGGRLSPRAAAMLRSVFVDANGTVLPVRAIARNILVFRERISAIIPQLENNASWQELLQLARESEATDDRQPAGATGPTTSSQYTAKKAPVIVAATDEEFQKSPRTFYKTIQEILTAPTERLDFERDDFEDEPVADLSDIVIDPAMINDTLLSNLGLDELKPAKRATAEKRMAAYRNAIPAIKEMLGGLEPFRLSHEQRSSRLRYFRLMRIGGGKNEGYLLGTQHINGKKILFRSDLHGAYRRIDHIEDDYGKEIGRLIRMVDAIKSIDRRVATAWTAVRGSDEMKDMSRRLLEMVDELKFVSNHHKVKIRKLIKGCVSFQTQRRQPQKNAQTDAGKTRVNRAVYNPGAMRARWNTVKDYVGKRIFEISRIKEYLAQDQARIQQYIAAQQAPFERFYETVESMHGQFKIFQIERPLAASEAQKISGKLMAIHDECLPVSHDFGHLAVVFEPYLSFAVKMAEHIEETVDVLKDRDSGRAASEADIDREAAAGSFMKIYLVAKIQYFHHELQKFYDEFLSPEKVPYFKKMLEDIEKLRAIIGQKRIKAVARGQLIKTPEYDAIFGEIYHLLNSLRVRARAGKEAVKAGDNEKAAKLKQEMHDRARAFRFDELLEKVGQAEDEDPDDGESGPSTLRSNRL